MSYPCIPPCLKCKQAGECLTPPAPVIPHTYHWPDTLTGKLLTCGCTAPIIPVVLGLIHPTHVMCPKLLHGWQPIPERKFYAHQEQGSQEEIPF